MYLHHTEDHHADCAEIARAKLREAFVKYGHQRLTTSQQWVVDRLVEWNGQFVGDRKNVVRLPRSKR